MSFSAVFLVILVIGVEFGVSEKPLDFYNAENNNDFETINSWYKMVNDVEQKLGRNKERKAMQELERESCPTKTASMCLHFKDARDLKKTVPGLWTAECIAVTMYTGDFYKDYNRDSAQGVWAPYATYTYLLLSAVNKLAAIDPIRTNEVLYRGLRQTSGVPSAKRIFWKTFTSTSTDFRVARRFGTATLLKFQNPSTRYGARIRNLSYSPNQNEVLLLPFESFDFLRKDKDKENILVFRSSDKQKLLKP